MTSAQGYADRLSDYDRKGTLDLQHEAESALTLLHKARYLATKLSASRHAVVHTGAGISTNAGIPDFRGPTGIWTSESRPAKKHKTGSGPITTFEDAVPTLTHSAITALREAGHIHYVISQNVDGLHTRSGLHRIDLSELHGSLFVDWCASCLLEFPRVSEARSVGFSPTGRKCPSCTGPLTDKALDWEDALPEPDFERACVQARFADMHLVVGTSCQMEPARGLPFTGRARKHNLALVNLSRTEFDHRFGLRIRADCDSVFALVAAALGLRLEDCQRRVHVVFECARISGRVRCMMRLRRDEDVCDRPVVGVTGVRFRPAGLAWLDWSDSAGYAAWLDACDSVDVQVGVRVDGLSHMSSMRLVVDSVDDCDMELMTACTQFAASVDCIVRRVETDADNARALVLAEENGRTELDLEDLFVSGKRRGYGVCVVCREEVWSARGLRDKHFAKCVLGQKV